MKQVLEKQSEPDFERGERPPDWLILHMIKLIEYAESRNLSTFEEKLIGATEALNVELNERRLEPLSATQPEAKVVPFAPATRPFEAAARRRRVDRSR